MLIPGYRIVKLLGEGGMAKVYLAIQESFDREVALKIMAPHLSTSDSQYGERFLREARIVAKLNHAHIVSVFDVGVHDGLHYLSMEYVPGKDLKHKRTELNLAQNLRAVKEIALALDFAHKKGYVHRDIKPENILIHAEDGRAVLTDFGIARITGLEDNLTQTGVAIGTPSYMSPEHALGKAIDHRADLYSLGVVMFYLIAGHVPFTGESAVAVGLKHAVEPVPRLTGALIVFQPVLEKILAKQAEKRFQSGHEFAEIIEELIDKITPEMESLWSEAIKNPLATAGRGAGADKTIATPTSSAISSAANDNDLSSALKHYVSQSQEQSAKTTAELIAARESELSKSGYYALKKLAEQKNALETEPAPVNREPAPITSKANQDRTRLTELAGVTARASAPEFAPQNMGLQADTRQSHKTSSKKNKSVWTWVVLVAVIVVAGVAWKNQWLQNVGEALNNNLATLPDDPKASAKNTQGNDNVSAAQQSELTNPSASTPETPKENPTDVTEKISTDIRADVDKAEAGRTNAAANDSASLTTSPEGASAEPVNAHGQTGVAKTVNEITKNANTEAEGKSVAAVTAPAPTEAEQKLQKIQALLISAQSAMEQGKLMEPDEGNAEKLFREILDIDANNAEAKNGLTNVGIALAARGLSLVKSGDLTAANRDYERALTLAPRDKDVPLLKQRMEAARREQDAQVYVNKAQDAIAKNQLLAPEKDNAYVHYQKALSIHPANKAALQGRKNLEKIVATRIQSLWDKKSVTEASALLALAQERYPDSDNIAQVAQKTVLAPKPVAKPSAEAELELQQAMDQELAEKAATNTEVLAPIKASIPLLRVSAEAMGQLPENQLSSVPLARTLHARFAFTHFTASSTVLMARLYDGSRAVRIAEVPVIVRGSEGEVSFVINRLVEGFAEGAYILDLMQADERLASVSFVVVR